MTEQPVAEWNGSPVLRAALHSLPTPFRSSHKEIRETYRALWETWRAADGVPEPPAAAPTGGAPATASGGEALKSALREVVDEHAAALGATGNPLWEQLQDTRKATARMRHSVLAIAGDSVWRKHIVPDEHWKRLWTDIAQESAGTYARLAGALAGELEREGGKETAQAAGALRKLSRAAAARSAELRKLPRKDLPTPTASAVDRELRQARTPHTGYALGPAGREQAAQASRDIRQGLRVWAERSSLGQRLGRAGSPELRAMRRAWQNLPSADLREGPRAAALRFGEFVSRVHAVREQIRKGNLGSYSAKDVATLDAVVDAGYRHVHRLAHTVPAGAEPTAVAYSSVEQAQSGHLKVAQHLLAWQRSDMGGKLLMSRDKEVTALRDAWRALPAHPREELKHLESYDRWRAAEKTAAFSRAAQAVLKAQATSGFPAGDLAKLEAVATSAMEHASRMAKIPEGLLPQNPARNRAAVTEQSARRAQAQPPAPAVAPPTPRPRARSI